VDRAPGQSFTYDDLLTSMINNGWQGELADLVRMPHGKLTSMNNTRITADREAKIGFQGVEFSYGEALTPEIQNARGWSDCNTWRQAITAGINNQSKIFSAKIHTAPPFRFALNENDSENAIFTIRRFFPSDLFFRRAIRNGLNAKIFPILNRGNFCSRICLSH
jgi:hypothetical protein